MNQTLSDQRKNITITGMHCASCSARVEGALSDINGVEDVSVNLATGRAAFDLTGNSISARSISEAIENIGFGVERITNRFSVEDITCASCVSRLEKILNAEAGVIETNVNLAARQITLTFIPGLTDAGRLMKTMKDAGYPARPVGQGAPEKNPEELNQLEYRTSRGRFITAAIGAVPVTVLSMTSLLAPELARPLMMIITALVLALAGNMFFTTAVRLALKGTADMNTLIAIGSGSAFLYSCAATVMPGLLPAGNGLPPVYFETATVIIALILLGRTLEARAKSKASSAISGLLRLVPKTAEVLRGDSDEKHKDWKVVPASDLEIGDVIRVRAGEQVPTDCEITEGRSALDESTLTGEANPVEKAPGDSVYGGTINRAGSFLMKATRVGAETTLAAIIRLVEQAQGSKAPIQRLADRTAAVFVPIVLLIAVITLVTWLIIAPEMGIAHALTAFVSVLIIACPCAMGLATPTAIMVGSGTAAARGVIFKGGETMETAVKLDLLLMDKTGTLTVGEPVVETIVTADSYSEEGLLSLAAAAELGSGHPLASAVIEEARSRGVPVKAVDNFQAIDGRGVVAEVDGEKLIIGSPNWLLEENVQISGSLQDTLKQIEAEGLSAIGVAVNNICIGLVGLSDQVRSASREAVADLKKMGLKTVMLTGDKPTAAQKIASLVNVDEFRAGVMPAEKAEMVQSYMNQGLKVGMVGDGVNDAPALAAADVGFAIGSGSDVALEAADVTLVGADPRGVGYAIRVARRTVSIIKQNLFWAFFYNSLGIPLAAGLSYPLTGRLIPPMFAAAAMAFSSISVVMNSLRLRRMIR